MTRARSWPSTSPRRREFAARGEANALEDAVVENGDRPLADVAAEVLTVAGW